MNRGIASLSAGSPPRDTPPDDPLTRDADLARLEAALWLAEEPLPVRKLAEAAQLRDTPHAKRLLELLVQCYSADGSPWELREIAGGVQLLTKAEYQPWLLRLRRYGHENRLTPTVLETLTVIAYRQPITRADLEAIRGVNCTEPTRILLERGLIRVVGRHDSLGRPQLYGTARRFLQQFGLNHISELPPAGLGGQADS